MVAKMVMIVFEVFLIIIIINNLYNDRLRENGIKFIIDPHRRFEGQRGDQYTMFFKDPSGNNLEFKHIVNEGELFVKFD